MTTKKPQRTTSTSERICPYCGDSYQPEACEYSEDCRGMICFQCGKAYMAYDSFEVTHYAVPIEETPESTDSPAPPDQSS